MSKSEEISDVLTLEGIQKLKVGQILMFDYEGSRNEYQVTKLNKKSGKCWVKPIKTYLPEEATITDKLGDEIPFDVGELNGN